jgi:hypothetical protein
MAQAGNSPQVIMDMLEKQHPSVREQQIWQSLKGKSPNEIEDYAKNLVQSLGLTNT